MIVEYLEKMYQEMYEKNLNLEQECHRKEILLRDSIKFVQMLEDSLDESCEFFYPRKVDEEKHLKINSLLENQKEIEEEIRKLKIELVDNNVRLAELESILKIAREKKSASIEDDTEQIIAQLDGKNILEVQEVERQRIARDMHDSVVQNLTNLVHKIEICNKIMDVDPIRCRLEMQAMTKTVREIIQDMREIIYNLRPMSLEDIGLDVTVERELCKIRNYGVFQVSFEVEGKSEKLSPIISLTMFRVIQEACNNIIKHSQAKNIRVKIKYTENEVEAYIEDDGIGFCMESGKDSDKKNGSGFGMSMMQERIYLLSGKLKIQSQPGKGTKIIAKVPIVKEDK